jgi:hypothetical protein
VSWQLHWQLIFLLQGFICSCLWIYLVANELVSLLGALGVIIGLSKGILGLTRESPVAMSTLLRATTVQNPSPRLFVLLRRSAGVGQLDRRFRGQHAAVAQWQPQDGCCRSVVVLLDSLFRAA